MNDEASRKAPLRFCVLSYSADDDQPHSDVTKVIALVTVSEGGEAAIRVHPEWGNIVLAKDQDYVENLFRDFKERTKNDSEALFRQLSALSVGPLITYDTGPNLAEHPAYLELMRWFREF
jgi:hypothetical protein